MSPVLASDVLTPRQMVFIAERLPEPPCAPRGRRPYSNLQLLPGILRVLRSGCRVDRTSASFHAFVYLAILVLCVRRVVSPSRTCAPPRWQQVLGADCRPTHYPMGAAGRRVR